MAGAGDLSREPKGRSAKEAPLDEPDRTGRELIFEGSVPGRIGVDLAPRLSGAEATELIGAALCREAIDGFPEMSEPQVVRHFLRLSQLNFSQALQFYPLGSCTMKYNPLVNDVVAGLNGLADLHPHTPDWLAQGALELMVQLERALCELSGMDAVSLHPAAGAQGELTGLLMIRAYHRKRGQHRRKIIIPDSAHGTNPASSALAGFEVVVAKSGRRGLIEAQQIAELMDENVAALMATNPNTLGVFEAEIDEINRILRRYGALLYLDGANFNALLGVAKPGHMGADIVQFNLHKTFSTPHGGGGPGAGPVGVKVALEPFLPSPRIVRRTDGWRWDYERPDSIGRLRSFYGNFGMLVRAYSYILALGGDGLEQVSRLAILNANYLKAKLANHFPSASPEPPMHECVLTHNLESTAGVSTLDIAKRLLDFGIHPPTIYFPLVVAGALMIEPTETESKQTIDAFVAAMEAIYDEARRDPQLVKTAPHTLPITRVDEARAARNPILAWRNPKAAQGGPDGSVPGSDPRK